MKLQECVDSQGQFEGYMYRCLCSMGHHFVAIQPHTLPNGASWTFTGNLDIPTLAPSILSKVDFWGAERTPVVCHHFVRDGMIQFLADCTHDYAGQTVPIPDWEE